MRRQASKASSRRDRHPSSTIRIATIVFTALLVAGVAVFAFVSRKNVPQSAAEAPAYAPLAKGAAAPRFQVTTLDGSRIDSASITTPIMLEVFATWCPHCQRETGVIEQFHQQQGDRIAIVAVSGSDVGSDHQSPETAADVAAFARYFGVNYPIAFDANLDVAKRYLQGGFPTIVFINRAKRITGIETGDVDLGHLTKDARLAGTALPISVEAR